MIRDTIWIVLRSYRAFIVSTGEVGSVMIFIAESKGERSFKIGQFWQRYRQEYGPVFDSRGTCATEPVRQLATGV